GVQTCALPIFRCTTAAADKTRPGHRPQSGPAIWEYWFCCNWTYSNQNRQLTALSPPRWYCGTAPVRPEMPLPFAPTGFQNPPLAGQVLSSYPGAPAANVPSALRLVGQRTG